MWGAGAWPWPSSGSTGGRTHSCPGRHRAPSPRTTTTTTGEEHEALHGFLAPVADALAHVEAATGADRRDAVRTLLHRLGQFDAGFAPAT